jgi:carbon starvation protein
MDTILILVLGVLAIIIGYWVYARTVNNKIIKPTDKATPAKMYMDGVDFTPANRNVLFGYQFKSIAALGPIVGPIVAVRWGWLPALLWIILGTFFIGWVQDYASIIVGVRSEGQTFGALSYRLISPRSRSILLIFIYCYLLLIMGSFGKIVGYDLMTNPAVPTGVILVILLGILAGQMTYKWKMDIILTSVVTVVGSFVGIWISAGGPWLNDTKLLGFLPDAITWLGTFGAKTSPLLPIPGFTVTWAQFLWSLVTLILCYFGAVLPIWRWAQPINYVAFWIVFLGILFGTLGLLIWHPSLPATFPAFNNLDATITYTAKEGGNDVVKTVAALGPLWPVLFVTIACGAISGWHSLVSSSGTARQLEREGDALFVGGGAMFLEMFLAVLSLLTAVVGVGAVSGPAGGWNGYAGMIAAGKNAGIFAAGLSEFLTYVFIPKAFGLPYAMVFLTLMALTIMYLVVRFMRVASAEFIGDRVPIMKNAHIGSLVALIFSAILIWTGFWQRLWVLFGGANQLMASLALLIVSLWLLANRKSIWWAFIPFVFMFVTTIAALIINGWQAFEAVGKAVMAGGNVAWDAVVGNVIAGCLALILVICALILAWDGVRALMRARAEQAKPVPAA